MSAERRVNFGCEATIRVRFNDVIDISELDSLLKRNAQPMLHDLAEYLDTDVVKYTEHGFPGQGITACAILASSHAIAHTWPEARCMVINIFCCSRESVKVMKKMTIGSIMDNLLRYGFTDTKVFYDLRHITIPVEI